MAPKWFREFAAKQEEFNMTQLWFYKEVRNLCDVVDVFQGIT